MKMPSRLDLFDQLSWSVNLVIDVDESLLLLGGHDEQVGFIIIQLQIAVSHVLSKNSILSILRIDPWGTPTFIGKKGESYPSTYTAVVLSER
jgi:hypothetical protein